MRQFDLERMTKLVSELRTSVNRLKCLSDLPQNEFLSDPDKIGSAKYHFIVAIESCIDMSNHIIARNGLRVPEDYSDTFRVLAEAGAFEQAFVQELRNMAKFRNRLVHLYWEVDDVQVYDLLRSRLGDFKIFLDGLSEYLDWGNGASGS
jgi:uncharacterized protein YutE (UPF0331/DUF86 family)